MTTYDLALGDIERCFLASGKFAVNVFGRLFVVTDAAGFLCAVGVVHNNVSKHSNKAPGRPDVMISLVETGEGEDRNGQADPHRR